MNIRDLARVVADKIGSDYDDDDDDGGRSNTSDHVLEFLRNKNKKFLVDGDVVRLKSKKNKKKKRKDGGKTTSSDEGRQTKKTKVVAGDADGDAVSQWRKENKIVLVPTTSSSAPLPAEACNPFSSFGTADGRIAPSLIRHCTKVLGFDVPTPIQAQAWPILLEKRDVVGIAETGSGKTLAFCLPALTQMMKSSSSSPSSSKHPTMLVLSPTRELAMQIDKVLHEFAAVVGMKSMVLYGGVQKYAQTTKLKRGGIDCVVATPGRLKDLIQEGSIRLHDVTHLVLDEADRMLDLGFLDDVKFIISKCASKSAGRQTAMFSATWPAAIQEIASDYMNDPVRVYVGFESITTNCDSDGNATGADSDAAGQLAVVDDSLSANKRVEQIVQVIDDHERPSRLRDILRKVHGPKTRDRVLVFALYKKEAERLEYALRRDGWNCCSIHGNKRQQDRTQALAEFKDGSCPILVATDVAARGLDIPNVEYVINYTFPLTIEDYVHRIGRTGRAGKTGISYTFFQPSDKARAGELQQVIRQAGQQVPDELLKFGSTIKKKEHKLYGNFGPRSNDAMKKATKITFTYSDDEDEGS